MNSYLFLLLFIWLPAYGVIITSTLEYILLWQRKEYRIDRMISHFKSEGHNNLQKVILLFAKLLLLLILSTFGLGANAIHFLILLFLYLFIQYRFINLIRDVIARKVKRPALSIRNLMIVVFTLLTVSIPLILIVNFLILNRDAVSNISFLPTTPSDQSNPHNDNNDVPVILMSFFLVFTSFISILGINILLPLIITIFVLFTEPFAIWKRRSLITKATKKTVNLKNLKTIGITGSYGKTSTKEILLKILGSRYQVVATPGNMNTAVGNAISILEYVDEKTEIFISEMGAYKKGEIRETVEFLPLDRAIITTIGKSHLDIFGSIPNIALAKSEILTNFKENGIAILNIDNTYVSSIYNNFKGESVVFSLKHSHLQNSFSVDKVEWDGDKVSFDAYWQDEKVKLTTNIIGQHQLSNLAAAIACALSLGFQLLEIKELLSNTNFEFSHFKIYKGKNDVSIIDDGYNTNPDGFGAALIRLKSHPAVNKILVTKGIPEIGNQLYGVYSDLTESLRGNVSALITTDKLLAEISERKAKDLKIIYTKDDNEMRTALETFCNPESVILVEGRIHPDTLNSISYKKS